MEHEFHPFDHNVLYAHVITSVIQSNCNEQFSVLATNWTCVQLVTDFAELLAVLTEVFLGFPQPLHTNFLDFF